MDKKAPLGIRILPSLTCIWLSRQSSYKIFILLFTFMCYTSYHISRKPISIVKSVLHRNCSVPLESGGEVKPVNSSDNECDWSPFENSDFSTLLGSLDLAYLFAYAVGMFFSGHIAERVNLRYFMGIGMLICGLTTSLFGLGYFAGIHSLWYYILIQTLAGLVQSSGWPSVVTCVGNWYGKGKRGFIMGIWNSHTSVGNILGSLIAGVWVDYAWGWSFIVPGLVIAAVGVLALLFLVPEPAIVGCQAPDSTESINSDSVKSSSFAPVEPLPTEGTPLIQTQQDAKVEAISFVKALLIPGVIEFSLCLFFAKLVSYTFLFWLPNYISIATSYNAERAADLSTLFDVGGIAGGIAAGMISDYTSGRASTCCVMLALAAPLMYIYNTYGNISFVSNVVLLLVCGFMVNGPYSLITTAVSADLGTSLHGNAKALATVTAIIDGTGSIGAAIGPLLTGLISPTGWNNVFWMLIAADIFAMVFLIRLVFKEIKAWSFSRVEEIEIVFERNYVSHL